MFVLTSCEQPFSLIELLDGTAAHGADYHITQVSSNGTPTTKSSPIEEIFQFGNGGTVDGALTVHWYAYVSTNEEYSTDDPLVDAGSHVPLVAGAESGPISIGGSWPDRPGEYRIVVRISADDDTVMGNTVRTSAVIEVFDIDTIDYVVTHVTRNETHGVAGTQIEEVFDLRNVGDADGTEPAEWEAYLSTDDVYRSGDTLVGTGSIQALASGKRATGIATGGTWPKKGEYYLVLRVRAADETVSGWDYGVSGPFTVADPPDYTIALVSLPAEQYGGRTGALLPSQAPEGEQTHKFSIHNSELAGLGVEDVAWAVYFSADAVFDANDTLLASGVHDPIPPGETAGPFSFGADFPLPSEPGEYFIVIRLTATDDASPDNNLYVSLPIRTWTSPNSETDTGGENDTFAEAEDYSVVLNPADSVAISGLKDANAGRDFFRFYTGPDTTRLRIRAEWQESLNLIDLYVYDGLGLEVASSTHNANGSEPGGPDIYLPVIVDGGSRYYVEVRFLEDAAGSPYSLTVRGG